MKIFKSRLDEHQEQQLLKLEHRGFWLAYFGLVISIFVQAFGLGYDFKAFAAETIILLLIAIYFLVGCIKNGIWDRHLKPSMKTNTLISVIAAVIYGTGIAYNSYQKYPDKAPISYVATGIFSTIFILVVCMVALSVATVAYKKRKERIEKPDEDEMIL